MSIYLISDYFDSPTQTAINSLNFLFLELVMEVKCVYLKAGNGDRGSTVAEVLCYKSEGR